MRRVTALVLSLLLLMSLAACGQADPVQQEARKRPLRFYYYTEPYDASEEDDAALGFGTDSGVLGWEEEPDLTADSPVKEVLERYLKGPGDKQLHTPFPQVSQDFHWQLEEGILTVCFGEMARRLVGVQRTLAVACMTNTMTQLADVDAVQLPELFEGAFTPEDFLLLDDTATSNEVLVKLYFTDAEGRYLQAETRSHQFRENESIPAYAVRQLLAGPEEPEYHAAVPQGTRLYWIRMEGGLCTLNFSEEFVKHGAADHLGARNAVFSIVNTLTEIPTVESVQILCSGQKIESYGGLDLREPLYREEAAIGQTRKQPELYDVDLYLTCSERPELVAVPEMVMKSRSQAADVLSALLNFKSANGYDNPVPEGTIPTELTVRDGLCRVVFNSAFALCDANAVAANQAVQAVVCTLCQLDSVDRVRIEIVDGTLKQVDLTAPLRPDPAWVHP